MTSYPLKFTPNFCAFHRGFGLETQRMHLETVLEADKELQLDVQRASMAWEIVLAQDRTIDWTTEELIAEIERAYLELETVGPWANSEKHSGQ